jgi:death-on-curing protein
MKGPDDCIHLTPEICIAIHEKSISSFGGTNGTRSMDLLESAVAAPQAAFGGTSTFTDLIDVAGAYLFYLCANHPFLDGNKRTALGACLVFLRINGVITAPDSKEWETLTLDVASGAISRTEVTERLRLLVSDAV